MAGPARTRIVALVVLLAVGVPLGVLAAAGSGDEDPESGDLRVERSTELPEILVYVSPEANVPRRAPGAASVTVECVSAAGEVVATRPEPWPLTETDGRTLDPHSHLPVNPARIGEVERCRLKGTKPLLQAPVA
jgi:hypothetical protein